MSDEFIELLNGLTAANEASPELGRDLIAIMAAFASPIDRLQEDLQLEECGELFDDFISHWDAPPEILRRLIQCYLAEAHTESGHTMREAITRLTEIHTPVVIDLPPAHTNLIDPAGAAIDADIIQFPRSQSI